MGDIDALIEEGESLERALANSDLFRDKAAREQDLRRFYRQHGPRLLRIARAAKEANRLTKEIARLNDQPCTDGDETPCPRCDALGEADKALAVAGAALDAALDGKAPAPGEGKP